jgi:3-isopropylmalate dehydrogenase
MLLNWLGQRHQLPIYTQAAKLIDLCMEQAIDAKETTKDIGGSLGTKQTGNLFVQRIKAA